MDDMRCKICLCTIALYDQRYPAAPAHEPLLPTRHGGISAAAPTPLVKNNPPENGNRILKTYSGVTMPIQHGRYVIIRNRCLFYQNNCLP
jgi:hypothetical protein